MGSCISASKKRASSQCQRRGQILLQRTPGGFGRRPRAGSEAAAGEQG
jgi:hypothetical protein